MLLFSHWLDVVGKLISMALILGLLFLTKFIDITDPALTGTPKFWEMILVEMMLLAATVVGFYFVFHRPVIDVVMTMLYVRQRFGIFPSWKQAKVLRRLFCVNYRTMKWYPMRDVRSLPVGQRLAILMQTACAL